MKIIVVLLFFFITSQVAPPAADAPINHMQVIGSHNSYKQAIDTALHWPNACSN
jgi:hypothetical protein